MPYKRCAGNPCVDVGHGCCWNVEVSFTGGPDGPDGWGTNQVDRSNPSNKWFEKKWGGLILDLWVVKVSISENCTINRYGWFPPRYPMIVTVEIMTLMSTEITPGRFPAWDIKMVSWIHWLFLQFIMHSNGFSTRSPVYYKQLPRTGGAFCIEAHDMKTLNLPH